MGGTGTQQPNPAGRGQVSQASPLHRAYVPTASLMPHVMSIVQRLPTSTCQPSALCSLLRVFLDPLTDRLAVTDIQRVAESDAAHTSGTESTVPPDVEMAVRSMDSIIMEQVTHAHTTSTPTPTSVTTTYHRPCK